MAMRDMEQRFVDGGMNTIRKNLARKVEKGKRTQADMDTLLGRMRTTVDMKEAAADADVIVEVIIELMEIKKKVYQELETIVKPECLFFTQHLGVSITAMAAVTKRPDRFIGTHFFNPVPVMKLLEIIKGYETSDETLKIALEWGKSLGKETIVVNEAPRPLRSTGSCARCSTKPSSCWARGWPRPRTSTRGWCWAATTRSARWLFRTWWGLIRCCTSRRTCTGNWATSTGLRRCW